MRSTKGPAFSQAYTTPREIRKHRGLLRGHLSRPSVCLGKDRQRLTQTTSGSHERDLPAIRVLGSRLALKVHRLCRLDVATV